MSQLFHSSLIMMFLIITFFVFLIPALLFILTLQKTLLKCAESSRTMQPGMVWLLLIPLFNLVWNFFVVFAIAKSLKSEFARRGINCPEPQPTRPIGLALSICASFCVIPALWIPAGFATVILMILYWIKVTAYSNLLGDMPQAIATQSRI